MPDRRSPFANSLFPFVAHRLAPHRNPVTCVLAGLERPLTVCTPSQRIEGDMVTIRPGVEHWVEVHGRAKVLYFDAMPFPLSADIAARVPRAVTRLATDALDGSAAAAAELRLRLSWNRARWCPAVVARTIEAIAADPMSRMGQEELSERLKVERTHAMRVFKEVTGMTFRAFKRWTALCAAAHRIARGELVRTAALDAGFADTAHLTRTFRESFGTTPTLATADLR